MINEVADANAERELAKRQHQLDAAWQEEDLGRQKELQLRPCLHPLSINSVSMQDRL